LREQVVCQRKETALFIAEIMLLIQCKPLKYIKEMLCDENVFPQIDFKKI